MSAYLDRTRFLLPKEDRFHHNPQWNTDWRDSVRGIAWGWSLNYQQFKFKSVSTTAEPLIFIAQSEAYKMIILIVSY